MLWIVCSFLRVSTYHTMGIGWTSGLVSVFSDIWLLLIYTTRSLSALCVCENLLFLYESSIANMQYVFFIWLWKPLRLRHIIANERDRMWYSTNLGFFSVHIDHMADWQLVEINLFRSSGSQGGWKCHNLSLLLVMTIP